MVAVILIVTVITLAEGAAVAIIGVVSAGIRREDREHSLTRAAPHWTSRGGRLLTGLYVRRGTHASPYGAAGIAEGLPEHGIRHPIVPSGVRPTPY